MKKYNGQMVYDLLVTESSHCVIPVRADSKEDALRIFHEFDYEHSEDVRDMLENGYDGLTIACSEPKPMENYAPEDILLPREENSPILPTRFSMHVIFEDDNSGVWLAINEPFEKIIETYQKLCGEYRLTQYLFNPQEPCLKEDNGGIFWFKAKRKTVKESTDPDTTIAVINLDGYYGSKNHLRAKNTSYNEGG